MKGKNFKPAPLTKVYEMKVNTVEEAFNKLCSAHPEIEYVLYPSVENDDGTTSKMEIEGPLTEFMLSNILTYTLETLPSLESMKNMKTSLLLKPNKVSLQTNRFMGFGWFIGYTKNEDRTATVDHVDLTITLYGVRSVNTYEQHLFDEGWTEKVDQK